MRIRNLVVVGLVGLACLGFSAAIAEDASGTGSASNAGYAVEGVNLSDTGPGLRGAPTGRFSLEYSEAPNARFADLGDAPLSADRSDRLRGYELAFTTRSRVAGVPVDVSIAQRGALGVDENGDIASHSQGSELRLGRGLAGLRRNAPSAAPAWYFFAASDDEALVWKPGASREFGGARSGFALQDRVEIGDMQAGITYERGGLQASLAYVERRISTRTAGVRTVSQDQSFAGVTLTMRR